MSDDPKPMMDILLSVRDAVVSLGGDVASLKSDVASMKGDIGSMKGDIASVKGDIGSMKGDIKALQTESTRMRVDMLARFDRVEARLSDMRDDISVSMARADHAHDAAVSTREELRAELQHVNAELRMLTRKQRRLDARFDELDKAS